MRYRPLGRTGIVVSEFCLGAMMLGEWGNTDEADCHRIVHRALDAGVNFIDTADEYAFGGSEEIVGRALKGRRDDVVLATKFNHQMRPGLNTLGNSRRWIMTAVEDSLRRLGTDYIDLYQAHRPDPATDIDETLGALSDLMHQGKIRAIGTSAFPAEQLVEAQWVSERRGRERFATEQLAYSILGRQAEAAVMPTAQRYGIGVLVFSPLNGGWLAGKYRRGEPAAPGSRAARHPDYFDHGHEAIAARKFDAVERLEVVAKDAGLSMLSLALGFVVAHPAVTSAIIGPRTYEQLEQQLDAADVTLSNDVLDRIDEIVQPGSNINPDDVGWTPPPLRESQLRRRVGSSS